MTRLLPLIALLLTSCAYGQAESLNEIETALAERVRDAGMAAYGQDPQGCRLSLKIDYRPVPGDATGQNISRPLHGADVIHLETDMPEHHAVELLAHEVLHSVSRCLGFDGHEADLFYDDKDGALPLVFLPVSTCWPEAIAYANWYRENVNPHAEGLWCP